MELVRVYYILFILIFASCAHPDNTESIKPKLTDITEAVYASVTVKPEIAYFAQSSNSGTISEIFVKEGDIISRGQLLFRISTSPDFQNRITNAALNLKEAEANYLGSNNMLLNIESELQSTKQQLLLDSVNFKRQENLWSQNIGKKVDLDRALLSYQTTQNNYEIALQKYSQKLTSLENNFKRAKSQMMADRAVLSDLSIRSQMDGKIYSISKEVGDLINAQEKFAEIGSSDSFIIEMDIDEVDITKVELGDTVSIILEAYPDQVFIARTNRISPKKDDRTQTFRVESIFENKPPVLYNGLSGEASIIVDNREAAIVIPSEYLMPDNKVRTQQGTLSVKIGVKNMQYTEILSGIDTSTVLLKPIVE